MTAHQMIINGLTIRGEPPFGLVYLGRSGIVGAYSFHFNSPHRNGFPVSNPFEPQRARVHWSRALNVR